MKQEKQDQDQKTDRKIFGHWKAKACGTETGWQRTRAKDQYIYKRAEGEQVRSIQTGWKEWLGLK